MGLSLFLCLVIVIVAWRRVVLFALIVGGNDLDDVPYVLGCVTEFTTRHTGTEGKAADGDSVVFEGVGKVIISFSHGTDEDTNALLGPESLYVILDAHYGALKGECHLSAVWWEVFRDWILDHAKKFLLRSCGANRHAMKKLDHKTSESLERARNADCRVDFDENSSGGVNVNLKFASLVDRGIEEGEKTLGELAWSWFQH